MQALTSLSRTLISLTLVATSACATGAVAFDRDTGSRARVQLDLGAAAQDGVIRTFPEAIAPQLPSADRIAVQIRSVLGETASAAILLCVAHDGHVESVALERTSTMPTFDQGMLRDIAAWRFAAMPGPATLRTCERFTISYRPHRG